MDGALKKGEGCLRVEDILPGEPTRLVLHLEPSMVHPLAIPLLVGQGEGGEELLEGHVPVVDGREDEGVGLVGALSLLALDVVETPGPRHDGRGVRFLLLVLVLLLRLAVRRCVCVWGRGVGGGVRQGG